MAEQTLLSKLKLIAKLKALLFDEENKNQTLKEAYSKGNMILLNEFTKSVPETQTHFETSIVDKCPETNDNFNPDLVKQRSLPQQAISQTHLKHGDFEKPNSSPEANNNDHIEKNLESNKTVQNVKDPKIEIDVLILITNENTVNYVKKHFDQPGIHFLHHLQDLKFENPTIIVRINASRNLDDRLEAAIQNKRPSRHSCFSFIKFFRKICYNDPSQQRLCSHI